MSQKQHAFLYFLVAAYIAYMAGSLIYRRIFLSDMTLPIVVFVASVLILLGGTIGICVYAFKKMREKES